MAIFANYRPRVAFEEAFAGEFGEARPRNSKPPRFSRLWQQVLIPQPNELPAFLTRALACR